MEYKRWGTDEGCGGDEEEGDLEVGLGGRRRNGTNGLEDKDTGGMFSRNEQ